METQTEPPTLMQVPDLIGLPLNKERPLSAAKNLAAIWKYSNEQRMAAIREGVLGTDDRTYYLVSLGSAHAEPYFFRMDSLFSVGDGIPLGSPPESHGKAIYTSPGMP